MMTTTKRGQHYIAGLWITGQGKPLLSKNPVDNTVIWQGSNATPEEINLASLAAHDSLTSWASSSIETRIHYLHKFAEEVDKNRATLNHLIALETGKPLWEAATETNAVIAKIQLSITAQQERMQEKSVATTDANSCLRFKPHGVVAVLGAFNFPAHLSNGHIVPALLAGNTVIYKPSELTPAVAELIMQCWHASGIPHGVINCVQGDSSTGIALLNTDLQGVYFTGSYQTGKRIHQLFGDRPEVILALEMGGNNPLIVDNVEDIDAACYQTILSAFITAGQRCTCARRIFIKDDLQGTQFLTKLVNASQKIKVGAFSETPEPFMGPVISHEHALQHLRMQQQLLDMGGVSLLPMRLLRDNSGLLSPGIIDMTGVDSPPDEEVFAPFLQVYRYQNFDDALRLANNTRYGLAAGLLSDSAERYQQFYQTIRAGLINWNKPTTGAAGNLPFGGIGKSGNHRPSAYFAADYCSYPIASMEQPLLTRPGQLLPGIDLE